MALTLALTGLQRSGIPTVLTLAFPVIVREPRLSTRAQILIRPLATSEVCSPLLCFIYPRKYCDIVILSVPFMFTNESLPRVLNCDISFFAGAIHQLLLSFARRQVRPRE